MALETVVYSQDPFGYGYKDNFQYLNANSVYGHELLFDHDPIVDNSDVWEMENARECYVGPVLSSPDDRSGSLGSTDQTKAGKVGPTGRRKRRRSKSCKNKEELENQRMTHIAVERNRRKQMNEYLGVIRSIMPDSYVQRGDQASIIGGAINYVKELEHHLQTLEAQKKTATVQSPTNNNVLFSSFFTFPQYSSSSAGSAAQADDRSRLGSADIEVMMAESHASLKVLAKKRPKQLIKLVAGLQSHRLTILHLNVTTTAHQKVLYSISVKLEEGCQLTTVDEIADAVNHLLGRLEQEALQF